MNAARTRRILRKRLPRDLRSDLIRYAALAFMIILCMFIVLSVVGAAYTVMVGSREHAARNCLEDGQFSVFVPLKSDEIEAIESSGVDLEAQFYLDCTLENGNTLRVFRNRDSIDRIEVLSGRLAKAEDEILLERRYCEENGIRPGMKIGIGGSSYIVVGTGTTPDYDAPYKALSDAAVSSETFGTAFLSQKGYERLASSGASGKAEEYTYAYRFTEQPTDVRTSGKHVRDKRDDSLKSALQDLSFEPNQVSDPEFRKYWYRMTGGAGILFRPGDTFLGESVFGDDFGNLVQFLPASDNMRILAAMEDVEISFSTCLLAGVILLILFTYIISVFVVHNIDRESAVIGTLYAMGVRRRDLIRHYLTLPVIVTGAAGVIGTLVGFSRFGIPWQMQDSYGYYSLPAMDIQIPFYLWIYGLIMPAFCAFAVNLFVIRRKCSQPVLRLLQHDHVSASDLKTAARQAAQSRRRQKRGQNRPRSSHSFMRRFSVHQMIRGRRAMIGMLAGLFISLLLIMISVNTSMLCGHVRDNYKKDTRFEYMYSIKYPDENPPADGTACYTRSFKKERFGYNMDVTLIGTTEDNPFFNTAAPAGGRDVIISSAMAQKYGLKTGSTVLVDDTEENRSYAFHVKGIMQYATAFYMFMDIDSARKLFDEEDNAYNVVFSDHSLDIRPGKLYGVTSRSDIVAAGAVFVDLMRSMVIMMSVISALIFAIEMYLMIRVMIDREAFGISLMKIFGWRTKEIRKLYMNGSFFCVAIGAAIFLPLSKLVMNSIFPYFVSNVPCGIDVSAPIWMFPLFYLVIIALYLLISRLLVRRLRQISPAVVLKNRE